MISGLHLPVTIASRDNELRLRRATMADLHPIIRLLSDDPISAGRGDIASTADEGAYAEALQRIIDDPSNDVLVVEEGTAIIGTLQLTIIPGMARRGSARLLIEAVRVASAHRSSGVGTTLMGWVVEQAAVALRTPLVQLTSDAARTDAHRFYRRLGFIDSHVGFKIAVSLPDAPAR
ncbi:transcriptional regulator [Curtobacterium oceanosedimentum]|uniref:Transcriptional regulator n=1 Tax=Curtobacterium oceanosedimentum TaxID=465820 RepID=A0ABR5S3C3_9MICO|nr:GNAT family N-acetyltransferase [Curtobacterium oceanosedimentum]KTR38244.1 transcriptional regulator [Curtobacterium oceanosedimentum]